MKALVVLALFLVNFFGVSDGAEGIRAHPGEFPWQVGFVSTATKQFCGGSVISKDWVLTAAHCLRGENEAILRFGAVNLQPGEFGAQVMKSRQFVLHEHFNRKLNNDIALIKLPRPLEFSYKIQTIKLPRSGETLPRNVTASGWGTTCGRVHPNSTLGWTIMTLISNDYCTQFYGTKVVTDKTFCAVSERKPSICTGDSGGPAVWIDAFGAPVLYGIISFGSSNVFAEEHPNGFVRIEAYLDWIASKTGLRLF